MMKTPDLGIPSELATPINLPAIALLPNSAKALREHRKRHPSEFEKVVRHKTGLSRYYSDEPSVCVGQWVLSQFTPPETQWVLFYPIEDEDEDNAPSGATLQWYGLHTLSGQVQREHIGTFDSVIRDFAFECNQSERVYIPTSTEEPTLPLALPGLTFPPGKLGRAATIHLHRAQLQHLPKRYLTHSTRRWQRPALIGMVCLCLTGLGAWLTLLNTPEPMTEPVTPDPLAEWFTQLTQAPSASLTLKQSEMLLTRAQLLPHGYTAQALTLSAHELGPAELVLKMATTHNAPNHHTLTLWRQRNAAPGAYWDRELMQLHLRAPLAPQDIPLSVLGQYPDTLYEQLRLLGADELTLSANTLMGQVEAWRLSGRFSGNLPTHLGNMAYLTANKPVFIRELSVTPHDKGEVDLTFTLMILGVTP